ncbi:MAG: hypothetical protein IKP64_00435 [Selenomonadaceae bacterium]|nr:hypothetical protein [Selenomonadaceae bacterium]MBR4382003.1 hypothetical protein [Selenomonadaceae bacterium]
MFHKFKVGAKYYELDSLVALFAVIESRDANTVTVTIYNERDENKKVAKATVPVKNSWIDGYEWFVVNVYTSDTVFTAQYPNGDFDDAD